MTTKPSAKEVWNEMVSSPVPFALIDPAAHAYIDGNKEYAMLLGIDVAALRGLSVLELFDTETGERIKSLHASFIAGGLRKTSGNSSLKRPDGAVIEVKGWGRRIDGLGDHPLIVTSTVEAASAIEPSDLPWLRRAPEVFGLSSGSVTSLEEEDIRAVQLEEHLWRIGAEVRAAGLLPRVGDIPALDKLHDFAELSERQREIVVRLMEGQRVPQIAQAMYLSPSTIRNHLTAVFRRFGVHSQAELIATLSRATEGV
jgi:DNA-binding CsgD family transcriptional regulator